MDETGPTMKLDRDACRQKPFGKGKTVVAQRVVLSDDELSRALYRSPPIRSACAVPAPTSVHAFARRRCASMTSSGKLRMRIWPMRRPDAIKNESRVFGGKRKVDCASSYAKR